MPAKSKAIKNDKEVRENPDPHIDQDFEGYPHGHANRKTINPKTNTEKKTASVKKKSSDKTYGK